MLKHCPPDLNDLNFIAGLDEVGRGCFAGPVVTAAVILPKDFQHELIKDSKKLTKPQLKKAAKIIYENALAYSVQAGSVSMINEEGIEKSVFNTMHACLTDLSIQPEHILIDGDRWEDHGDYPFTTVVKGDDTYLSIAAAAIIAKVRRDEYMEKVHEVHPHYNFAGNKGYYCQKHKVGLIEHGKCRYHRDQYVQTWAKNQGLIIE